MAAVPGAGKAFPAGIFPNFPPEPSPGGRSLSSHPSFPDSHLSELPIPLFPGMSRLSHLPRPLLIPQKIPRNLLLTSRNPCGIRFRGTSGAGVNPQVWDLVTFPAFFFFSGSYFDPERPRRVKEVWDRSASRKTKKKTKKTPKKQKKAGFSFHLNIHRDSFKTLI